MRTSSITKRFEALCGEAARCRRCSRFSDRQAVLGPACGSLRPKVLFIGEAPGRQGADRTRVPFSGDASGRTFETLLAHAGLKREEIFITNAVLCCPADERRNRPPSTAEIRNCLPYLAATIALLRPCVVATIGAVALKAIGILADRKLQLSEAVGQRISLSITPSLNPSFTKPSPALRAPKEAHSLALAVQISPPLPLPHSPAPHACTLIPLYHPSPRVLNTCRNLDQQQRDYAVLRKSLATRFRSL